MLNDGDLLRDAGPIDNHAEAAIGQLLAVLQLLQSQVALSLPLSAFHR